MELRITEHHTTIENMKRIEPLAYLLFFTGLFEKVVHTRFIPFPALIMAFAIIVLLLVGIVRLMNKKESKIPAIVVFAILLWMVYLFVVLKYFVPYQLPALIMAIVMSVYATYRVLKEKQLSYRIILWVIFMLSGIAMLLMPLSHRYYIVNIKFNTSLHEDPFFWDRYSWWLNNDNEKEEAIEANQTALMIIDTWEEGPDKTAWQRMVESHQKKLDANSWSTCDCDVRTYRL